MSEENKTIVRRIAEEGWNERKYDIFDEFFSADFVNIDPGSPEVNNLEQYKQWVAMIHNGFSDHHVTIQDLIAEGDKVVKQWSLKATHDGELMEIPPTNKQVSESGITIYRIVDGKVKECVWGYDNYSFFVQLGVIPSE